LHLAGKITFNKFYIWIADYKRNSVKILFKKMRNRTAILIGAFEIVEKLNNLANRLSRNYNTIFK